MCSTVIVKVTEGKLKGKVCVTPNNVQFLSFKGIPYAKPPIGDLRFSIPVPPEPWSDVRDATNNCNVCAQYDRAAEEVIGSEDCLYLNVYTPKLPSEESKLRPVMVFFHGGGFAFGNGTDQDQTGPDYLIEKDVIVVMLNYRLGILGFLCLDRKEAPGNMGLRDQVQALKWVNKNISKFNGDPNNITIFGVSAGGASVGYLMVSPLAKGLFHKAIAQSGSILLNWANAPSELAKEMAAQVAKIKGIPDNEDILHFLKRLSTTDLVSAHMTMLATRKFKGAIHFGFAPTIEKTGDWERFFDRNAYTMLSKGEFTKVPFIGGFCQREGLLMVARNLQCLMQEHEFVKHLPFNVKIEEAEELEKRLKNVYLRKQQKGSDDSALDYLGDLDFLGGVYTAITLIAKTSTFPTYMYEFDYDGGLNHFKRKVGIDRAGTCHGDDLGYLIKSDILKGDISEKDKLVRERMLTLWANFGKYGDPTPETNNIITTKWEPMTSTSNCYLHISGDPELKMKTDPYPERVNIFKEMYEKYCS